MIFFKRLKSIYYLKNMLLTFSLIIEYIYSHYWVVCYNTVITMFLRPLSNTLVERLDKPRRVIQTLIGPQQKGKTTIAR